MVPALLSVPVAWYKHQKGQSPVMVVGLHANWRCLWTIQWPVSITHRAMKGGFNVWTPMGLEVIDVLIAISESGSTKDIIESAQIAHKAGATVIGITGRAKSPLSKTSNMVISVNSKEAALLLAPMTSRLVQLAIIDVLFVAVAMGSIGEYRQQLNNVKKSLIAKRY